MPGPFTVRRARRIFLRAAALRCPRCGHGAVFRRGFAMYETCSHCELVYEREQGYFVGAIYLNYAATALVVIGGHLVLDAFADLSLTAMMVFGLVAAVLFPLAFFRYSKSLWLAVDYFINPERPNLHVLHGRQPPSPE